jgi:voltage-gated potassium channel
MVLAGLEEFERRHVFLTGLRAAATGALVLVVYFTAPVNAKPHGSVLVRLSVGLAFFVAVLTYEVRAILRSDRPMLRATDAMALVIPVFVAVFAWVYLTMALSAPHAFSQPLNRTAALYFAVTLFSTVGLGDIAPVSDAARAVVTIQMVADLIVIAVVVRLIFGAARGSASARARTAPSDSA